jgi:hypothetical protein
MNSTFETPILLITFNRPTHTRRVWDEIKKQRPKYVYVFQDGAREGNETDTEKCDAVRAIFDEERDWECQLKTFYSDKNMGCGPGPAAAITWFFDNVEQGIVFEDDCLPSETLFAFYEQLLNEYKNENMVSLITGTNLKTKWKSKNKSYIFSTVGAATMGSWASWRRAWSNFDYNMTTWELDKTKYLIKKNLSNEHYFQYYASEFSNYNSSNQNHVWDYQWFFCRILMNSLSIVSTLNQMSNIGFGDESTHTNNPNDKRSELTVFNINLPLIKSKIKRDRLFDWIVFNRFSNPNKKSIIKKAVLRVVEMLYCR